MGSREGFGNQGNKWFKDYILAKDARAVEEDGLGNPKDRMDGKKFSTLISFMLFLNAY